MQHNLGFRIDTRRQENAKAACILFCLYVFLVAINTNIAERGRSIHLRWCESEKNKFYPFIKSMISLRGNLKLFIHLLVTEGSAFCLDEILIRLIGNLLLALSILEVDNFYLSILQEYDILNPCEELMVLAGLCLLFQNRKAPVNGISTVHISQHLKVVVRQLSQFHEERECADSFQLLFMSCQTLSGTEAKVYLEPLAQLTVNCSSWIWTLAIYSSPSYAKNLEPNCSTCSNIQSSTKHLMRTHFMISYHARSHCALRQGNMLLQSIVKS